MSLVRCEDRTPKKEITMNATLLIPSGGSQPPFQIRLRLDPTAGSYGLGRLKDKSGVTLDGVTFRTLRESGASLTPDAPEIRAAMGLQPDEPLAPQLRESGRTIGAVLREIVGSERGAIAQAAGKLGVGYDTLSEYIRGRSTPGAKALLRICRGLGVSLAAFDGCEVE
jgi:DNA-binding phage protein